MASGSKEKCIISHESFQKDRIWAKIFTVKTSKLTILTIPITYKHNIVSYSHPGSIFQTKSLTRAIGASGMKGIQKDHLGHATKSLAEIGTIRNDFMWAKQK